MRGKPGIEQIRRNYQAVSLTFCVLLNIELQKLMVLLRFHKGEEYRLRMALVRKVARAGLIKLAAAVSRARASRVKVKAVQVDSPIRLTLG